MKISKFGFLIIEQLIDTITLDIKITLQNTVINRIYKA